MRADITITEFTGSNDLSWPGVVIREWDQSPILFVVARVEYGETTEELLARAAIIAKVLTIDRPPKRLSAGQRAADID